MSAVPQHMEALARANVIRLAQANALREVNAGRTIRDVLFCDDPQLQSIPIGRLLRAQHRWGRHRSTKLLYELVINEKRPIRRLTARQKDLIASEVEAVNKQNGYPGGVASVDANARSLLSSRIPANTQKSGPHRANGRPHGHMGSRSQ